MSSYFLYFWLILNSLIVSIFCLTLHDIDISGCEFTEDIFVSGTGLEWSYAKENEWEDLCQNGGEQSPIDLPKVDLDYRDVGEIRFHNYASSPFVERMVNTGHSIMMDICSDNPSRHPRISGGGLNDTYIFHQLHFHWSNSDSYGSEHTKSGTFFPLEVQLIHYKESMGSFENALYDPDGLAILSSLFQLHVEKNPKWDHFLPQLENVTKFEMEVILNNPFPLLYLLPNDLKEFYRYKGSLTAPPCTENVFWTVFQTPVPILLRQLDNFRRVHGPPDKTSRYLESKILKQNTRSLKGNFKRHIFVNGRGRKLGGENLYIVVLTMMALFSIGSRLPT